MIVQSLDRVAGATPSEDQDFWSMTGSTGLTTGEGIGLAQTHGLFSLTEIRHYPDVDGSPAPHLKVTIQLSSPGMPVAGAR